MSLNLPETAKYSWQMRESASLAENFFKLRSFNILGKFQFDENKALLAQIPHFSHFKDMDKAVARTMAAIQNKEKIIIFGDYDVDGTTSCAMLRRFFEAINYPVEIYIPERLIEGYGLNVRGLQKLKEQGGGLVITVDNGIAAVDACEFARSVGMDVIITDHHDIPPTLPNAFAIINPKQPGCDFPFKMLAGVGVAFYFMSALRSKLRETGSADVNLKSFLDFVALGTIADLAPLEGVNHVLCKLGLSVMGEQINLGNRPGLKKLLELTGWKLDTAITAQDVGFKIGPRLNAAGRLGNALATEEVLSTHDVTQANEIAEFLHMENSERQKIEKGIKEEAFAQIADLAELPSAFVLHAPHWHTGVVGIVASRVVEKFYRPTLVLGTLDGKIKGSGRSIHSFDLFSALNEVRGEFESFGGHFHAVGVTIKPDKLSWLQEYLHQAAKKSLNATHVRAPLFIDGMTQLSELTLDFISSLEHFEPFGLANPRPKWLVQNARVKQVTRIGKDPSANHARVVLEDSLGQCTVTAFEMAPIFESFQAANTEVSAVIEARVDTWNGRRKADLRIVDVAPSV